MKNLFIDSNIWLSLYHFTNDDSISGDKFLGAIKSKKAEWKAEDEVFDAQVKENIAELKVKVAESKVKYDELKAAYYADKTNKEAKLLPLEHYLTDIMSSCQALNSPDGKFSFTPSMLNGVKLQDWPLMVYKD